MSNKQQPLLDQRAFIDTSGHESIIVVLNQRRQQVVGGLSISDGRSAVIVDLQADGVEEFDEKLKQLEVIEQHVALLREAANTARAKMVEFESSREATEFEGPPDMAQLLAALQGGDSDGGDLD